MKVRLYGRNGEVPIGTIGCITEGQQKRTIFDGQTDLFEFVGYRTDALVNGRPWCPKEETIKLVYDGDASSSWEDCAWKPEKVHV